MRIAYLGNFHFPFCTEVQIAKTLESMGHEVIKLQENEVDYDTTITTANLADLFLWTRTPGFLQFDGWEMLKNIRVPKVSYHLDLYMGINREKDVEKDPFFYTDYVFQADGDPISLDKFRQLGINAIWAPAAVLEFECYLAEPEAEFRGDIAFVGSKGNYHSEWNYRRILVDWLKNTYGDMFKHYASENGNYTMGHRLNQLYASTKIIIGDSLCVDFKHSNYWSNRIVETLGRGGFLIAPRIPGIEKLFKDGENIVLYEFGNFGQLEEKIAYYLANPKERQRIMFNGYREVKNNHTFTNRMEDMFKVLKENGVI